MNQLFSQWISRSQIVIKWRKSSRQSSPNLPSGSTEAPRQHPASLHNLGETWPHVQLRTIVECCVGVRQRVVCRVKARLRRKSRCQSRWRIKTLLRILWATGWHKRLQRVEARGTSRGADGCVRSLELSGMNVAFRKTSISCSRLLTWP